MTIMNKTKADKFIIQRYRKKQQKKQKINRSVAIEESRKVNTFIFKYPKIVFIH